MAPFESVSFSEYQILRRQHVQTRRSSVQVSSLTAQHSFLFRHLSLGKVHLYEKKSELQEPSAFDPFFLTAVSSFLWFGKGPQATTRKGQQLSS